MRRNLTNKNRKNEQRKAYKVKDENNGQQRRTNKERKDKTIK